MNYPKPSPSRCVPSRPGDAILVTVPYYWGRGATLKEAIKKLEAAGGRIKTHWRVHSVHPDTQLNELGYFVHPAGHAPVMLQERNP